MRLGQLARKLEVRPAEIVQFLAQKNIRIEEGSNTRVEDDHVNVIIGHFNPALLISEKELKEEVIEEQVEVVPQEQIEEVKAEELETKAEEITYGILDSLPVEESTTTSMDSTEVIKATKTELPGLKVLGKIELPEVRKKEVAKSVDEESTTNTDQRPTRPARQERRPARNNNRREEAWKNPIELQRERDAKLAEEKRKEQLELEKEKRMVHYLKKVKKNDRPVKTTKLENEITEEPIIQSKPKPKTLIGRFFRWFKGG